MLLRFEECIFEMHPPATSISTLCVETQAETRLAITHEVNNEMGVFAEPETFPLPHRGRPTIDHPEPGTAEVRQIPGRGRARILDDHRRHQPGGSHD